MPLLCCILLLRDPIVASIVVGSIGAAFYATDKRDGLNFKPTMCFVKTFQSSQGTCSRRECTGVYPIRYCSTVYYKCYKDTYTVTYDVPGKGKLETETTATGGPGRKAVSIVIMF